MGSNPIVSIIFTDLTHKYTLKFSNDHNYQPTIIIIILRTYKMKIVIKTLQGKQLPIEVEETYTVSPHAFNLLFRSDKQRIKLRLSTKWLLTL